jgi:NAD(P)-dependent dehydrogenase (short-subunit alcohol dehydrogenase family)
MRRFDGYGVLITGAAQGIGAATARRFAAEGAAVLVTDLDGDHAERTAADIRGTGGKAEGLACDIADRAAVEAAVAHAADRFGSLDVLVNNAYSCHADAPLFEDQPDDLWHQDIDITLSGAMLPQPPAGRCPQRPRRAAPSGRRSRPPGRHRQHRLRQRRARLRLPRLQRREGRPRVSHPHAGRPCRPPWRPRQPDRPGHGPYRRLGRSRGRPRPYRPLYPLGRVGEPEDIAAAVLFLASADASWITGVTLPVDGGILISHLGFRR